MGLFGFPSVEGPVFFVIRFRRRLRSLWSVLEDDGFFSNFLRSILSPAIFKPVNFLYLVVTFSVPVSSRVSGVASVLAAGLGSASGELLVGSSTISSGTFSSTGCGSVSVFGAGLSSEFCSKSIFPTFRSSLSSVRA